MAKYTQANQSIAVTTPLGADVLLLESFRGTERTSGLFDFELNMLAAADADVDFSKLLGQSATIRMDLPDGAKRFINGIFIQVTQEMQVWSTTGDNYIRYSGAITAKAWLLTRVRRSRIFQNKTVPDILTAVLTGVELDNRISGTFEPRDYCVQYRETDLDFAKRLMEDEGIFFYFTHADGSHKMVLANTPQGHDDVPGPTSIMYDTSRTGVKAEDRILNWSVSQEIRSGKHTLWDHCFELPGKNLESTKTGLASVSAGTLNLKLDAAGAADLEIYDYPGDFAGRFDGVDAGGGDQAGNLSKIFDDGTRTVAIRQDQETAGAIRASGDGNARQLQAGCAFTLENHFSANGKYVLLDVEHSASIDSYLSSSASFMYRNTFTCIPYALPYRPPRTTAMPVVRGTQTAVVVGPSGDEIFTDKYGRVKVQFPWDRDGKLDANSSCWVRVAMVWAGKLWGGIHIPRIGQEVIVAFLEGDPNQPIIVGSVYNADQMPPYVLPDNMTQSGIKSRSSPKGADDNFNELRFEDKKDSELVYFQAEKDFTRLVKNDDTLTVNKNRKETIVEGDDTYELTKGNRSETLKEGNDTYELTKGNRSETLKEGNDSLELTKGNRSAVLKDGNDALELSKGDLSIKASAGSITIEAAKTIELKVGGNSITIETAGITVKANNVTIQGEMQADVKSKAVNVTADADLTLKGGAVMIN